MSVLPAAPFRAASGTIPEADEVAAYLAAVEGTVWVTPGPPRERHEGVLAEPLQAGDKVEAEAGSRASIFRIADAAILEATADSTVLIGTEIATGHLLDVPDEVRAILRSGMERWGRWTAEFAPGPSSADPPGQVTPLSPRNELVLERYPTFFWTGEPTPLRLKVKDEEGSRAPTNLLRCAYYGELGAWTHVLAVSRYLPVGPLQERAWDLSRERMGLDEGKATHLFALLVWKRLGLGGGDVGNP